MTYVNGELEGSQGADHEETGTDTSVGSTETKFLADLDQTAGGALTGQALGLVDLGKHGVGWLGDDGGGETGDQTGAQVDTGLGGVGQVLLGEGPEGSLGDLLEDDELGHGVGNPVAGVSMDGFVTSTCQMRCYLLLEQDGTEAGVESADTLLACDLAEAAQQTAGVGGLGNETDTGSLERAEGNIGEELAGGGGGQVDTGTVVGGVLVAEQVDGLLLEELVTSELEGTLQEVTSGGGTEAGQQSASTLILDDLLEAADHASVVGGRVELDTGLDAVFKVCVSVEVRRAGGTPGSMPRRPATAGTADASVAKLKRRRGFWAGWVESIGHGSGTSDVHIDGGEGTVCYRAADGTGEGESGVELDAAELARGTGGSLLDDGIDLGRAGGWRCRGHCD